MFTEWDVNSNKVIIVFYLIEDKIDENLGQTILFGCRDNLVNKDELKSLYLEEGMKFKAACPSACLEKEVIEYFKYKGKRVWTLHLQYRFSSL
jgi:hypothetical protein